MTDRQRERDQTRVVAPDPAAAAALETIERARQEQMARDLAEAERIDTAHEVEGGRYKVGDQFVDANGEPIKEKRAAAEKQD